jgi:hypothetical protein
MRQAMVVVIAVLAGMLLGGWGPRSDLRSARAEIEDLKRRMAGGVKPAGEVQGVRQMLRIANNDAVKQRAAERAKSRRPPAGAAGPAPVVSQAVEQAASATNADSVALWEGADIEEAAKMWKARTAIARNSFVSNLRLDAKQSDQFDTLVAAMNLRLETGISNWVQGVKAKGDVTTEDGLRLMNELSSAVVLTYDELDRAMPAGWRKAAGGKFDAISFVDPAVAMPFIEVEEILRARGEESQAEDASGGIPGGVSITIGETGDAGPAGRKQ